MEYVWNRIHKTKLKNEDGSLPYSNLFSIKATRNATESKSGLRSEGPTINH
jgi:hypothetical protein